MSRVHSEASTVTPFDQKYLSLQFLLRVHQATGTEFQSLFERIMDAAHDDFQKIRPHGREGDKGNDGYRPSVGIYYQVYAPLDPAEKEAEAAAKFKRDFGKLKLGWDKVSQIREFNFVYNDKGAGVSVLLENARADLARDNPDIAFKLFLPKQLEKVFLALSAEKISLLGFDVDSRNVIRTAREQLEALEAEIDAERGEFVLRVLDTIEDVIVEQRDEALWLDYAILQGRGLQKAERVPEARERFESIAKQYPSDPRPFLYLAEITINAENADRNAELIATSKELAPDLPLIKLQEIVRAIRLGETIDEAIIDENTFPTDARLRSNFYRLSSAMIERGGDQVRAEAFVARALELNPKKFFNHDANIALALDRVAATPQNKRAELAPALLAEIDRVEAMFVSTGGLSTRGRALLNGRKLQLYGLVEDYRRLVRETGETVSLLMQCHFDHQVDRWLAQLIQPVELTDASFATLQQYLKTAEKKVSDVLAKALVFEFMHKGTLLSDGRAFFSQIGLADVVAFIDALQGGDDDRVLAFLANDVPFAVPFALAHKGRAELRHRIVENLPNDGTVEKDKLLLLLHYDTGDLDKAYEIVRGLDLHQLSVIAAAQILRVARDKRAWDAVVVLLEKILAHENEPEAVLHLRLQLFDANFHLERFTEVIRIGKSILAKTDDLEYLEPPGRERLVLQTAHAFARRGDPGLSDFIREHERLLITFEAKIGAQAEAYVRAGDGKHALDSVVEAVRIAKRPTPEQYAALFFVFGSIGNLLPDFTLESAQEVAPGFFVKLAGHERWYFVGDGEELDATKVTKADRAYSILVGRKVGDSVKFDTKYRKDVLESAVEMILPMEKYILAQAVYYAKKLTDEQRWDAVEIIDVPPTDDGSIDVSNLVRKLQDLQSQTAEFFELYTTQEVPLALLALSEGGLPNAIGRIATEQKGFIKATSGDPTEFNEQKRVASDLIQGSPFFLDGTSALFLAEAGVLRKVANCLPGMRVPQSVVTLLFDVKNRFADSPGQRGSIALVDGRLRLSEVDAEARKATTNKFADAVEVLEGAQVVSISAAGKADVFTEQKVPANLVDACVLAKKESMAVVTEDFLFVKVNEFETGKAAPSYCSTWALMRVLYEKGKITFDEYLDYFAYLASYRVRFLPFTTDDLETAIVGDGVIKFLRPEQLRKFVFGVTLSEDYGVAPATALQVVGSLLLRLLIDDSVGPDIITKVFVEIVSTFPTKQNRKTFARALLVGVAKAIDASRSRLAIGSRTSEKVQAIVGFLKVYGPDDLLVG